jgi:hypothetical protein
MTVHSAGRGILRWGSWLKYVASSCEIRAIEPQSRPVTTRR